MKIKLLPAGILLVFLPFIDKGQDTLSASTAGRSILVVSEEDLPAPSSSLLLVARQNKVFTSNADSENFASRFEERMALGRSEEPKKSFKAVDFLVGEAMMALLSTAGFAKNGAYWSAAGMHVMSLAPPTHNKGFAENDATRFVTFGLLNGLAAHHYFVKPTSGAPVFWRNFIGLNTVFLTSHVIDKAISRKKARRLQ